MGKTKMRKNVSSSESDFEEEEVKSEQEDEDVEVKSEEEEEDETKNVRKEKKKTISGPPQPTKEMKSEDYAELLSKINRNTRSTKHKKRGEIQRIQKLLKKAKKNERGSRKREAEALGEDAPPRKVPNTLESLREPDSTHVDGKVDEVQDEIFNDEFSKYFEKTYEPKVLITSSENPLLKTRLFLKELSRVIPNAQVFHRRQTAVKQIIEQSVEHGFTDIIVINEHKREPSSMLISHLPKGPTAFFKVSNVKLTKHIKRDWREITSHRPEIIATNFTTRLGVLIGRMLASLFHYDPQFKGRRAVTFHNQRDYIFIRHHRYEFKSGKKVAIRELGPRFTLKLRSLQKGTFDSKTGEYEWIITNKRHQMEGSRRKFYL